MFAINVFASNMMVLRMSTGKKQIILENDDSVELGSLPNSRCSLEYNLQLGFQFDFEEEERPSLDGGETSGSDSDKEEDELASDVEDDLEESDQVDLDEIIGIQISDQNHDDNVNQGFIELNFNPNSPGSTWYYLHSQNMLLEQGDGQDYAPKVSTR